MRSEIFVSEVPKALTFYSKKYDNILLTGDFNITPENHHLKDFTDSNDFENLVKGPTCYKITSPTTIVLFLRNRKYCFMKSSTKKIGILDNHKLIYTSLKSTYVKGNPKFVCYRCLKNFNKELFKKNLSENLKNIGNSFEVFNDAFTSTLDCYAPLKKKKIRSNHNKFMTKKLRKEVMTRSRLRKNYNKNRTYENWSNYKKQRNIYTNILKKTKTDYFNNIDIKNITDNKRFWAAVKPFLADKSKTCNNIISNENDKSMKDGKEIANKFNKYFANIIKKLNLKKNARTSFESQESCRMIKMKFGKENLPSELFTEDTVANAIKNLPTGKASVSNDIPVSIMKETFDAYRPNLTQIMNDCMKNNFFLIY